MLCATDSETVSVHQYWMKPLDLDTRSSDRTRRFEDLFLRQLFRMKRLLCLDVYSYSSQVVYSVCLPRRTAAEVATYFVNFYL